MLLLRKETTGVWTKHKYRGADIELKIRPAEPDHFDKLRKQHTKTEFIKDPDTRQMVKSHSLNHEMYVADMVDYLVEDFKGVGYSKDEPLEVNKDNKVKLITLSPMENEQPLYDFILEQANKLRTLSDQEAEEQGKNS